MTKGKARSLPAPPASTPTILGVDDTTLAQLCEGINCAAEGVKSHLTHVHLEATPGTLKDGIMRLARRVKNARVIGDSVRGDVHLHAAGANSPTGNLREYLLTLAEEDPPPSACPPCSHPTKRPVGAMARSASPRSSSDFVGEAGSTNDGLLSAGPGAASQPGTVHGGKGESYEPQVARVPREDRPEERRDGGGSRR